MLRPEVKPEGQKIKCDTVSNWQTIPRKSFEQAVGRSRATEQNVQTSETTIQ